MRIKLSKLLLRLLPTVCAAVGLAGCGSAQLKDASSMRPLQELAIKIQDLRPANERESSKGSLLVPACLYGIPTYGDDRISPSPVIYLGNYINKHFTNDGRAETLVLRHLHIVYNFQVRIRGNVAGFQPGLLNDTIQRGACYPGINTHGGIDYAKEDASGAPAMLVYIEGDFRGSHFAMRHLENVELGKQFDMVFPVLDHTFAETFSGASDWSK